MIPTIIDALKKIRGSMEQLTTSRNVSMAITKVDESVMWLERQAFEDGPTPPSNLVGFSESSRPGGDQLTFTWS